MCSTCGCRAAEEIDPVESVIVPAPMGRGVAQYYAEGGESATYAPSQEPEGSTPATEPTNESFNAEMMMCIHCANEGKENPMFDYDMGGVSDCLGCGDTMCQEHYESDSHRGCEGFHAESKSIFGKDKKGKMYARRRNGRIITHNAESKSMFSKDKNGRMYARRRNGRIITHNAEHEGVYACSKCKHWNRNPVDGITKCKKCGNGTFAFVKKSEFMPDGDGNVVGQQTFGFNGTPLHAEEDTSFGLVGEGNNFGQMRAEDFEADFSIERPFQTGVKLSAGLLTGAALFGLAGATFTALIGSMMDKGE